ncbi:low affinity iron permease family protein [Devosia nitrariae]|uniref:Iron permease n=1 Tax=Devosia nitrariae TaxID=2071872 RepID=A0ABQ5W0Z2_9HYPH|nr:low affinity iron permease family protein [Devosia nitrariae]GLQ53739.1 iron permease [Devosia nitrariae]
MSRLFSTFSRSVAKWSGRPITFAAALALVVLWAVTGPFFGFSETWQLVINTATTIVTFLMVFVLQNTQNRDGEALHAKLDELLLTSNAENRFIEAERLTDEDIRKLRRLVEKEMAAEEDGGEI